MAQLTSLSKGLIALMIVGGVSSIVWNLGLKDRVVEMVKERNQTDPGTNQQKPLPATASAPSGSTGTEGNPASSATNVMLRLSGSNTIGANLAPRLIEAWLASLGASSVVSEKLTRNGQAVPEATVRATLGGRAVSVEIRAHGSGDAFAHLAAGSADIGMSSRMIKPEEAGNLANLGDMRSPENEHVIALDGIAVIVAPERRLDKLTREDLARIFAGEVTDWSAVGSGSGPIQVHARDDKSGTYDSFRQLVLGGKELRAGTRRFEDSAALDAAVAGDPGAIGFVGLPYVKMSRALAVADGPKTLPLNPTVLTIKKEDYALARRLYFYTATKPPNAYVRQFVRYVQSEAGQGVVKSAGFVDQNLSLAEASRNKSQSPTRSCTLSVQWVGAKDAYCTAVAGKTDLGTNFRFKTASTDLDNRAIQDLQRLLKLKADNPAQRITLIGFADSQGNYETNRKLADRRARTVQAALRTLGIDDVEVAAFGHEIPVADNDSLEGRERNRRVEVWIN